MRVLTVKVMAINDAFSVAASEAARAMGGDFIGNTLIFPTVEQLAKTMLAPNRWQIIRAMEGGTAVSIRELARKVGRDFRGFITMFRRLLAAAYCIKPMKV